MSIPFLNRGRNILSPGFVCSFSAEVHLFDIDIPNGITFKESETLTGGDWQTLIDTGTLCMLITGLSHHSERIARPAAGGALTSVLRN